MTLTRASNIFLSARLHRGTARQNGLISSIICLHAHRMKPARIWNHSTVDFTAKAPWEMRGLKSTHRTIGNEESAWQSSSHSARRDGICGTSCAVDKNSHSLWLFRSLRHENHAPWSILTERSLSKMYHPKTAPKAHTAWTACHSLHWTELECE